MPLLSQSAALATHEFGADTVRCAACGKCTQCDTYYSKSNISPLHWRPTASASGDSDSGSAPQLFVTATAQQGLTILSSTNSESTSI